MSTPENQLAHHNGHGRKAGLSLFGSGLRIQDVPGVDPSWRFNPEIQNWDFVGTPKPEELEVEAEPST